MGLLDYFKELAGEVDERDGQINIRTDFANRPGALYLCINKESHRVTSVRLCDIASRLKEDTFESFICEQVKQVKKLDFIPNEIALFYFVPDLATVPRVHKEENDHFIPYIQDKQPQMKIDLTDAAFAVKYGFDLIENDKCFSAVTSGVGNTERYREFMESNEKERYRGIVNYYLDGIQEDYRRQKGISARNPIYNLLQRMGDNENVVGLIVHQINRRKDIAPLMMRMLKPVIINTKWGRKNISDAEMLNYVAKNDMKYLSVEFRNQTMLDFFKRNGLLDAVLEWCGSVSYMDDYVLHRGPGISDKVSPIPGLTVSETLYQNILDKGAAVGQMCYRRLCRDLRKEKELNPIIDLTAKYPDFIRKDCPGERPLPPGMTEDSFEKGREATKNRSTSWFHL